MNDFIWWICLFHLGLHFPVQFIAQSRGARIYPGIKVVNWIAFLYVVLGAFYGTGN